MYSWLPAPAHLERFAIPFLSPVSGRPHLCTRGCGHPLTWQGLSSLPFPQPLGILTFVLVAAGTHSLGKVCRPFPLPSLWASSPLYSWLPAPTPLARFAIPSLAPASGRPHLCTHCCWHPLTWKGWSSLFFPHPLGVLNFVLVAAGTCSLGKVFHPFPLPSLRCPHLCTRGCWHLLN